MQAIRLLAQGHTAGAISKVTAFDPRGIERLVARPPHPELISRIPYDLL